jgi:hypothetical protein
MMQRDYFRSQIGRCGEGCDEEDEGLCPQCLVLFKEVQAEDDKLAMNRELDAVLKKLRQACNEDKTGEFQRLLDQSRHGKVFH